ncbi:MAG: DUF1460 domain-containing protein [Tannerella sp.]|jgi:hypothetical protein|nr:DUF1460 domain-containing protein [Tannerella sp.]
MYLRIILILTALSMTGNCLGQALTGYADYTDGDIEIWNRCAAILADKKTLPTGDLIIEAAHCFADRPYVASTLEKEPERLIVNLRELDCTTFVETVVAVALAMKETNPSFESFCRYLQKLRYRNGTINDYTDRLHYFSDWIFENSRKGFVRDVTQSLGGEPLSLKLSYMSTHPDSYRQLKSQPGRIRTMREKEEEISLRTGYAMIPPERIHDCAEGIKNGDIVCFVTNIEGLDVSHVGFVYRQDGALRLVHASSTGRKVMIDERPLQVFASAARTSAGVMIVRIMQ